MWHSPVVEGTSVQSKAVLECKKRYANALNVYPYCVVSGSSGLVQPRKDMTRLEPNPHSVSALYRPGLPPHLPQHSDGRVSSTKAAQLTIIKQSIITDHSQAPQLNCGVSKNCQSACKPLRSNKRTTQQTR